MLVPVAEDEREMEGVVEREKELEEATSLEAKTDKFWEFFKHKVSEWNPCFSGDGRWRYKWDAEIGAHDVDAELDPLDEAGLLADEKAAFAGRESKRSSEERAVREVHAR